MQSSGNNPTDNRRGSSIFAASEQGDASGPYGRPAYLYGQQDGSANSKLLVDFPDRNHPSGGQMMDGDDVHMEDTGGYDNYSNAAGVYNPSAAGPIPSAASGTRRGSDFMSGAAGMGSGMGNQGGLGGGANNPPRLGEAARMQELANSQDLPGGPNHRPLVGGFAAAAYEAAKAHHYSMKRDNDPSGSSIPRDRPAPPSI